MKNILFKITLLVTILILSHCHKKDDPTPTATTPQGTVEMIFRPTLGNQRLVFNQEFTTPKGEKFTIKTLKFFVSNIGLSRVDASEANPSPYPGDSSQSGVYLVDFTRPNMSDSAFKIRMKIDEGEYVDTRLDIAVPRIYNLGDITKNPFPINNSWGMYWNWNSGYQFLQIDGTTPKDTGGTNNIHLSIGVNSRAMQYSFNSMILAPSLPKIIVNKDKVTQIFYDVDIKTLLTNTDGSFYSLKAPIPPSTAANPGQVHGGYFADVLKANSGKMLKMKSFVTN